MLKEFAISNGITSDKKFVTKDVENTAEEAVAEKELISPSRRIILVTSAYHMYREKRLFEKQRLIVIPYRVIYKFEKNVEMTIIDFLPSADNLQTTETAVREIISRLFYLVNS